MTREEMGALMRGARAAYLCRLSIIKLRGA